MKRFVASALVELEDAEAVLDALCEHMVEHGAQVEADTGGRILNFRGTRARFSRSGGSTQVDADAASLEDLYFLRLTVASHIVEFAGPGIPPIVWQGDGQDLVRPPNFRILEVLAVRDVTPHMRRITFTGSDITRFDTLGDLHLNVLCQHAGRSEPQWPTVGPDGLIRWEDEAGRPQFRKYTVRSIDKVAGTLDIDFVLHADAGLGSALAERVQPGEQVGVIGPGGGGLRPAGWYLLAGDETALPAIGRMLEHLPQDARGKALIEVADEAEKQALRHPPQMEVEWLLRDGAAAGTTTLLADAVRAVPFPQDGASPYVWAGCEFEAFRSIRAYLRKERGLGKDEHLVVSYWRREAPGT